MTGTARTYKIPRTPASCLSSLLGALLACLIALPAAADEQEEGGQEFLMLLESAYLQHNGEWQLGLATEQGVGHEGSDEDGQTVEEDGTLYTAEIEYGLTDRLEVSATVPYTRIETKAAGDRSDHAGVGDVGLELGYALVEESAAMPALTLEFGLTAPTGDHDRGLGQGAVGYEAGLRASKRLDERLFVHANVGYEWVHGAREGEEKLDEREWELGLGLAYGFGKRTFGLLEYQRSWSREKTRDEIEIEKAQPSYLSLGFASDVGDDLEVGAGIALGLGDDEDNYDRRLIFQFQREF